MMLDWLNLKIVRGKIDLGFNNKYAALFKEERCFDVSLLSPIQRQRQHLHGTFNKSEY